MSVFTCSSMKSGSTLNVDTMISLVDSMACYPRSASSGTLVSTTSSTMAALTGITITTVTTSVYWIWAQSSFSISNATATQGRFAIYVNGSNNGFDAIMESSISATNGLSQSVTIGGQWITGQTGVMDFQLRYNRSSGAGTVYAKDYSIYVAEIKSLV
jgi:hypothetical protein